MERGLATGAKAWTDAMQVARNNAAIFMMIESKVREYIKNNDRNDREIREAIQSINQSIDKEDGAAAGRLLVSGLKIPVSVCMHAERKLPSLASLLLLLCLVVELRGSYVID